MTSARRQAGHHRFEVPRTGGIDATRPRNLLGTAARHTGIWLAGLGLAVSLQVPPQAIADPSPTGGQQRQARAADPFSLAAAQARLAAASARVQTAQDAVGLAVEAFNRARIDLTERRRNAALTTQTAERSVRVLEEARAQVGRLAADVYRDGQDLGGLEILLASGGIQGADAQRAALTAVGRERRRAMQRMDAARTTAMALQEQSRIELERAEAATRALGVARTRAEQVVAGARTELAAATAQKEQALRQIAVIRRTTLQAERALQARAERLAERRAAERLGAQRVQASDGANGSSSTRTRRRPEGQGGNSPNTRSAVGAGDRAVAWARRQVGLPYRWGGAGPDSYDCSGLTMRAWQHAGVQLPHFAASQYSGSTKVAYSSMRPGDLIFYATDTSNPSTITHVTMYLGGGMMIEAPYTGASVRIVEVRYRRAMPTAARP